MDDAVILGAHRKVADAKLFAIALQRLHLLAANLVVNGFLLVAGGVVVGHGHHLLGAEHLQPLVPQRVERLGRGYLVGIQPVDV